MQADTATVERGRPETVGLITPSHRGDLERCEMLFASIDRHVRARGRHYVVVHDEDVPLFARFRRADRDILPVSDFLPGWLRPVPALRWRGRQYWWSLKGLPISGWHAQQIVKIRAAASLSEERYCIIDSDNVFFRDFDLAPLALPNPAPMHIHRNGVHADRPRHVSWTGTASRLLDTPMPPLPCDDYIDQIVVWDQATVREMIDRIESVSGRDWVATMCRDRDFSEYMIYGRYVSHTATAMARHAPTSESVTRTHWDGDALGIDEIVAMLRTATPRQKALCIQSFGATPVSTIRTALAVFHATQDDGHRKPPTLAA